MRLVSTDERRSYVDVRRSLFSPTKFAAPPVPPTLVSRPSLVATLDEVDRRALTIVVGPPGSGKSVLLAEWYSRRDDGSIAWLSADRADADPTRFWRGFIAAVQLIEPAFGKEVVELLDIDGLVTADSLEALLADDSRLDHVVQLVIDDFHLVSPAAAADLHQLLERRFEHLRLVIGGRSDPAVGLHRLRLRQDLTEIREVDLRFSIDETTDLLSRMGVESPDVDPQLLHDRTEGWAAAVQLAALSLRESDDPGALLSGFVGSSQTVAGYLTAEVLSTQPERIRRFLEATCVVEELTAPLCLALTGPIEAPGVEVVTLEEVEAANLLLSRIDQAGTVFRYHHLFVEMLRHRLLATDPRRYEELNRLAAEWYLDAGDVPRAVEHFWLAGLRDRPGQLLRDHIISVYVDRGSAPLSTMRLVLSDQEIRSAPGDMAGYGLALILDGRGDEAIELLQRVESLVPPDDLTPADGLHLWAALTAACLQVGRADTSEQYLERALDLARRHQLHDDDWLAALIPSGVRTYAWMRRFEAADSIATEFGTRGDPHLTRVDLPGAIATIRLFEGRHAEAAALAKGAHAAAIESVTSGSGPDVAARAVLGCALAECGDVDHAEVELRAVLDGRRVDRIPMLLLAGLAWARMLRARGEFDAALRSLSATRQLLPPGTTSSMLRQRVDLVEARIRLAAGDVEGATEIARGLPADPATTRLLLWIDLAVGRFGEATAALRGVQVGRPDGDTPGERLELALLTLRLAVELGSPDIGALADDVLTLAEPDESILVIAESGAGVLHAVCQASRHRPRSAFVDRLVTTRPLPQPERAASPTFPTEALTDRELDVLRYMATSMSNQEIADALFVSVNTVKTHVKHVLRKTASSSRTGAVARAKALHYL